jgi:hypothetical protein
MAAFVIGLTACGGGTQVAGGGIGGTGISQGPITGFGSIFVNGVEFNTDNATIIKDGTTIGPVSTPDLTNYLKIGMVVTVDGDIANSTSGTAATVTYAKELQGPIAAKTSDTLSVLGQTVIVDNLTKIEVAGVTAPASIADLKVGNVVEVSGFSTAGGIRATYIEAKQAGATAEYELKGTISTINGTLLTIGIQTVDINGGASFNFTPKVGDYVEVKGTIDAGGNLVASSMELKSRALNATNAGKAELQGYVTSTTSATDFVLNAQPVQINSQTKFSGGIAADIKPGLILEVEGSLVNGTLIATKISFEDDLELEGTVHTIDTNTKTLTLDSYPNISIAFSDILTELEGVNTFIDIAPGDLVKVRGRTLDVATCSLGQCVLATQLTVESTSGSSGSGGSSGGTTTSTSTELQGPVDNIVPGLSITVLGVTVNTASITSFSGDGISDSSTFFDNVKIGDLVDVTGTQVGTAVTWDAVEVDN